MEMKWPTIQDIIGIIKMAIFLLVSQALRWRWELTNLAIDKVIILRRRFP